MSQRLHLALRDHEDALLRESVVVPARSQASGPAQAAAAGPRAEGARTEYELLVELILEGYRLHYGGAGKVVQPNDADLTLLLGDQLYAMGLERLAALGDLDAVVVLADVISLSAQVHAEGKEQRADAAWDAAGQAVGHGRTAP
jgi:hypothetical protein